MKIEEIISLGSDFATKINLSDIPVKGLSSKQKWTLVATAVCSIALCILLQSFLPLTTAIFVGEIASTIAWGSTVVLILDYISDSYRTSHFDREREGTHVFDKDVFLILRGKDDHNGATLIDNPANLKKLKKQTKYVVVCKKVGSVEEMCQAIQQIKNQGNRIQALWIDVHGAPNGFHLGNSEQERVYQISNYSPEWREDSLEPLREPLLLLEKTATIVLNSCSTGKVGDGQTPAIAQTLADLAPYTSVYAPINDLYFPCSVIESLTPLKVKFYQVHGRNGNIFQKIGCVFWKILGLLIGPQYTGKNITACFKAYPRPITTSSLVA